MKNIFSSHSDLTTFQKLSNLVIALCISFSALAQAPQGFNYQAVVLNSSGAALSNQTVSLQLSILDSSASGVAVYVETQNPTTDTTGLFSVVIGNGTVVTGNFSTINWGKNNKFLKTEIDTAGGSNYVLMGISQMMSVPYALYANQTNSSSVSLDFPDGLNNIIPIYLPDTTPYVVPVGKNFYLPLNSQFIISNSDTLFSSGVTTWSIHETTIGFSENQTVISHRGQQGYLVDKSVEWITTDIATNPLTVPAGKIFVVKYSCRGISCSFPWAPSVFIDGNEIDVYNS